MAYDLEEQEKLDALRAWWDRYGTLCVIIAFTIVAGILGWRGWQWYEGHQANQAMSYYEALETATAQPGDDALARIKAASSTLRTDFSKSGYTPRGVLVAAQALQARNDLDGAAEQLQWLIKNSSDASLVALAKLRLAGIFIDQQHYDQALDQLSSPPAAFVGLYADRRGDVLIAQGKPAEARTAWETALKSLGADPIAEIVQLKIDALGGA